MMTRDRGGQVSEEAQIYLSLRIAIEHGLGISSHFYRDFCVRPKSSRPVAQSVVPPVAPNIAPERSIMWSVQSRRPWSPARAPTRFERPAVGLRRTLLCSVRAMTHGTHGAHRQSSS